ncbi:MAG TPA: VWA domain-containing protein [Thermoanaerobaculia bacterium]|nr:VWA domain-containing protein [Thermoanaerobaculia bacterium]
MARSAPRAAAALLLLLFPIASILPGQTAPRPGTYREEARVDRVVLDAFVTDKRGDAMPGLTASNFRVLVDGRSVPLESAEWIAAETPEVEPAREADAFAAEPPPTAQVAPGRLMIFFFQTDFVPTRLLGLMRMSIQAKKFLDTLFPTDRVAVLSFDSHLKLRQDFTADREKIVAAIHTALRTGNAAPVPPQAGPSLARNFDYAGALRAVTPERALELISKAAAPIPGGKSMLFFGWGLGTIGGLTGPGVKDIEDFSAALPALARARITIFSLDVTDADYHTLQHSLENISDLTGGSYLKTNLFPSLAIDRVRRAIEGRYVLVFVKPSGARGHHEVRVSLAAVKGHVQTRTFYED